MALIEAIITVPVAGKAGIPFTDEDWAELHIRLAAISAGLTRRGPHLGVWTDPQDGLDYREPVFEFESDMESWEVIGAFVEIARWAAVFYRSCEEFAVFASQRTFSPDNPALAPDGRLKASNVDHPLFRAVLDLESRLGVRQGVFRLAEESDVNTDPTGDELLSIAMAAGQKGVTRETVYNAIDRGEIVATRARPIRVSSNSLRRWRPFGARQHAGRASADARST